MNPTAQLKVEYRRPRVASARRSGSRFLVVAVLLSVVAHLLALLAVVLLPRALPSAAKPAEQGTIELLMVEQKGAEAGGKAPPQESKPRTQRTAAPPKPVATKTPPPPQAVKPSRPAQPPQPVPPPVSPPLQPPVQPPQPVQLPPSSQPDQPAVAPPAEPIPTPPPPPEPAPPPPAPEPAPPAPPPAEPSPAPAPIPAEASPQQPEAKPAEPQPAPAAAEKAPVFNLEGTDSESNAIALGGHILPAKPDDRFRNRPPIFPVEAEMLGQHGEVTVVIHVAENGLTSGVDVLESSGVPVLDEAAIAAVRKWRFHPAMKDGQTIPFDMPFRFVFEAK